MSATARLAAVNTFLEAVYGPATRISTLLADYGYPEPAIVLLRERHLNALLEAFVQTIGERLAQQDGGDRQYLVLARLFGLDGAPRATGVAVAQQLDISRERVRQIEARALRRCRSSANRRYWLEVLDGAAQALLAGVPDAVRRPPAAPSPPPPAGPARSPHEPAPEQLQELINAVRQRAGNQSPWMYAHVLYGSVGPKVEALVRTHGLQQYGVLHEVGFGRVKALVREALLHAQGRPSPLTSPAPSSSAGDRSPPDPAAIPAPAGRCLDLAFLQRFADCGDGVPSLDAMRLFLEWRAARPSEYARGTLDRWRRVNRGRVAASWLTLADSQDRHDADPGELGAMCCQLALVAANEMDTATRLILSDAVLCPAPAELDHRGLVPPGANLERLMAAFAALITGEETRLARDLWLSRLAAVKNTSCDGPCESG